MEHLDGLHFIIFFNNGEGTSQKYHLNSFILVDLRILKFKMFFNHGEKNSEKYHLNFSFLRILGYRNSKFSENFQRSNVEKRFLKLFCKLPGAIMGQNGRSGRIWAALESHDNFF